PSRQRMTLLKHKSVVFFFQAEDGIRGFHVTGVQTCALPISRATWCTTPARRPGWPRAAAPASARNARQSAATAARACRAARTARSEERRVGKECRTRGAATDEEEKGGV